MNFLWFLVALALCGLAIYLFRLYQSSHPHDWSATLLGVALIVIGFAIILWRGSAVWQDASATWYAWQLPSLVQKEMDKVTTLAKYYDEKALSDIQMAPIVGNAGELEVTLPKSLLSESACAATVAEVHQQMKVTEAGSPYKDWKAKIERVRYYFEDTKLVSIYVRFALVAPDPYSSTGGEEVAKGFGSYSFRVRKPDRAATLAFLEEVRNAVTRKLLNERIRLPGNNEETATAATSPAADSDGTTISVIPDTGGLTLELPEE